MSAFVPAFALIGFTLAMFTNTLGAPATIGLLLIWIMSLDAKTSLSLAFGTVLGLLYAWAFRLAPLLRWELWRGGWRILPHQAPGATVDDPVGSGRVMVFVFDPRPTLYLLSATVAWAGAFFLFNEIATLFSGVALLLLGVGAAVYILFTWYTSESPSHWLTAGFSLAATAILLTPLLYTVNFETRFVNQVLFHIVLLLLVVLIAVLHVRWLTLASSPSRQSLANDTRAAPSQTSAWRVALRWILVWLVLAVLYLAAGIADVWRDGSVDIIVRTVFVTSLVLGAIAFAVGSFFWWRDSSYAYYTISSVDDAAGVAAAVDEEAPDERASPNSMLFSKGVSQNTPRPARRIPTNQLARNVLYGAPRAQSGSRLSAMELKSN
jgi:hypothetical protein